MSDAAAASPVPAKSPSKKASKSTKPKAPAAHPSYKDMVVAAVSALKERGGSSRHAILKYILSTYKVSDNQTVVNNRVKAVLKNGVTGGIFKQTKGTGAAGSFRMGEKPKVEKKKPAAKKPAAKKTKKPASAKKSSTPKKAAAKTKKPSAKKVATATKKPTKKPAAKSPKKAVVKKPAAAKKSPKKTVKKPAAKKTAAKK